MSDDDQPRYTICMRADQDPGTFRDNLTGVCTHCGAAIIYRPYMPAGIPKICVECAVDALKAGHA